MKKQAESGCWAFRQGIKSRRPPGGNTDIVRIEETYGVIREEINKVVNGKVTNEEIEQAKIRILLNAATGFETNAGFANYYEGMIHELKLFGKFINFEDAIEAVTPQQFLAVAKGYLSMDKALIVKSTPTLTIEQLAIMICIVVLAIGLFIWIKFRKIRGRVKCLE